MPAANELVAKKVLPPVPKISLAVSGSLRVSSPFTLQVITSLEIIFANRSFDPGILFNVGNICYSLTDMVIAGSNTFQTLYNRLSRAANIELKTINKAFNNDK